SSTTQSIAPRAPSAPAPCSRTRMGHSRPGCLRVFWWRLRRQGMRCSCPRPPSEPRYNLYPAAELDGAPSPGYSQGQAIQIMQRLAAETLPDGFRYEWTNLAFQQMQAGNTAVFAFVLAVMFVFLVLAAQYESVTLPLAVILIVPMCLIASITGVILRGQ